MSVDDVDGRAEPNVRGTPPRLSATVVLRDVVRRLRADPFLAVPFTLAGLVVALADWLRVADPLPASEPVWMSDTASVQYSVFPGGTARTVRELGAFVDLQLPYLFGGLALEAAVALAVGVAGWLTITRCLSTARSARSFLRYVVGLTLVSTLLVLLPTREIELGSLPLALLAVVVLYLVVVRVFLLPGLLATGSGFLPALAESVRLSRGGRAPIFWLALALGVTSWGLATVPTAGGFLSTAVVGTVHAVGLGVLVARLRSHDTAVPGDRGGSGRA